MDESPLEGARIVGLDAYISEENSTGEEENSNDRQQQQLDPHFVIDLAEERMKILPTRPDDHDENYVPVEQISVEEYEKFGKAVQSDEIHSDSDDNDSYIHCDHKDCDIFYRGSCREHPLFRVKDRESTRTDSTRAYNSIPAFLRIKKSSLPNAGLGVFSNTFIPIGMTFGPYEGLLVHDEAHFKNEGYAWQLRKNSDSGEKYFIDGSDENYSNWMRFINSPSYEHQQNLLAFQYFGSVYYRVIKPIQANDELLVWYGESFGKSLSLHTIVKPKFANIKISRKRNPFIWS